MSTKEQILTAIALPAVPLRRPSSVEKAGQLLHPPGGVVPRSLAKLTTRVLPEQLEWLRGEVEGYRQRHPRAPRLTVEELTRLALDHLRASPDLDGLIAQYRA